MSSRRFTLHKGLRLFLMMLPMAAAVVLVLLLVLNSPAVGMIYHDLARAL